VLVVLDAEMFRPKCCQGLNIGHGPSMPIALSVHFLLLQMLNDIFSQDGLLGLSGGRLWEIIHSGILD
jgi:hypothetical protein